MATFGGLINGPGIVLWFRRLDRFFPPSDLSFKTVVRLGASRPNLCPFAAAFEFATVRIIFLGGFVFPEFSFPSCFQKAKKVAVNQLTLAPFMNTTFFGWATLWLTIDDRSVSGADSTKPSESRPKDPKEQGVLSFGKHWANRFHKKMRQEFGTVFALSISVCPASYFQLSNMP